MRNLTSVLWGLLISIIRPVEHVPFLLDVSWQPVTVECAELTLILDQLNLYCLPLRAMKHVMSDFSAFDHVVYNVKTADGYEWRDCLIFDWRGVRLGILLCWGDEGRPERISQTPRLVACPHPFSRDQQRAFATELLRYFRMSMPKHPYRSL